jgi:uncharacterized membrane protein YecN with MAPEG domain
VHVYYSRGTLLIYWALGCLIDLKISYGARKLTRRPRIIYKKCICEEIQKKIIIKTHHDPSHIPVYITYFSMNFT